MAAPSLAAGNEILVADCYFGKSRPMGGGAGGRDGQRRPSRGVDSTHQVSVMETPVLPRGGHARLV